MNLLLQRAYAVATVAIHAVRRSTVTPGFKSSPYWLLYVGRQVTSHWYCSSPENVTGNNNM